jgi:BirA family biotin operon repressor/biotin-[acetyl-CoA-carboxylase] ligase
LRLSLVFLQLNFAKNSDSLLRSLKSNTIGEPFIIIPEVESTNNYAMGELQNNAAKHGTAWFAHSQTQGKGQRGKSWVSYPSENIILTVALAPALQLSMQFSVSMAIALAASDFFMKYAGDETSVKWPNDIYWRDRKAAGILIENIVQGSGWQWAVAGIGMNVNQTVFPDVSVHPVSIKQITGKQYDSVEMAKELCACINERWKQIESGDFEKLHEEYNQRLFKRNETVKLKKENIVFEAKIVEVNSFGELIVEAPTVRHFQFGEVEWVI